MADKDIKQLIRDTFLDVADILETGKASAKPIAITGIGSELGEDNVIAGALIAKKRGVNVVYIGKTAVDGLTCVPVSDEQQAHKAMEEMLDKGEVAGAVTMHYPFPIGVSTVGRVNTPATGREAFIATTTGTADTNRVAAMVKNALYGIIAAKASGLHEPSVGLINLDGARQAEGALRQLAKQGYPIHFAESQRADGGCILRGNDVLRASADVLVTDSLTGNVMIKMLSAFQTGGAIEAVGAGYGPGIGKGFERLILIISRASGPQVIAGALGFADELARNNWLTVAANEFALAKKAGLDDILNGLKASKKDAAPAADTPVAPAKVPVTEAIAGIEVMDLEDAVHVLWREGLYAESGMGCTGPVVMIPADKLDQAMESLKKAGYIH